MRGIGNKATLLHESSFQPFYHLVKDESELLYLIPCLWNWDPLVQIFCLDLVYCMGQSMNRSESSARQPVAHKGAEDKNEGGAQEQPKYNMLQ